MREELPLSEAAKHYLLRLCDNSAAYEILPRDRSLHLDLVRTKVDLAAIGFTEVVDARVMLIMKREFQVNLYNSGRILLSTETEAEARRVAAELAELLY